MLTNGVAYKKWTEIISRGVEKMVGWIKQKYNEWKVRRALKKRLKKLREQDPFIYE